MTALRSGRYKQGKGQLKDKEGRYCCLGVACEVYRKAKGGKWTTAGFQGTNVVLPNSVRRWFGFTNGNPTIAETDTCRTTGSYANDDLKWSFKKIASAVEKMYLKGDKGK